MERKLSQEEFDGVVIKRAGETAIAIAQRVLVEGCGYSEVAREFGVTRQYAYQSVRRFLALVDAQPVISTYSGPVEMFAEIDRLAEESSGHKTLGLTKMLTAEQFEEAVSKASFRSDEPVTIARRVLVDGEAQATVKHDSGLSKQRIWLILQAAMKYFDPAQHTTRVYGGHPKMFEEIDAIVARYSKKTGK